MTFSFLPNKPIILVFQTKLPGKLLYEVTLEANLADDISSLVLDFLD